MALFCDDIITCFFTVSFRLIVISMKSISQGPFSCTFKQIRDFYWNHLWQNPWSIKTFSPHSDQTTVMHTILSGLVYIQATKDVSLMLWGWLYVQRHGRLIYLDKIATEYFWKRNKLLASIVTVDWSITACPWEKATGYTFVVIK